LFSSSLNAFAASLTPEDRQCFENVATPEDLLQKIELQVKDHEGRRATRTAWFHNVQRFSQRLAPFFDVVSAFVQIKPEFLGGFWGSVLLVCKVS